VFGLLADAPSWQRWAGPFVPGSSWEPGTPDGAGAVRRLGLGPLTVREQVVVHQRPHAFAYVLLTGARWHGYRADVRLTASAGGTEIAWAGRLSSPVPGVARVLRPTFRRLVADFAERLARQAEDAPG
jgi:hypothetical protein